VTKLMEDILELHVVLGDHETADTQANSDAVLGAQQRLEQRLFTLFVERHRMNVTTARKLAHSFVEELTS